MTLKYRDFDAGLLAQLISARLPPVLYSFTYGSRVFPQSPDGVSRNSLVDLILSTDDVQAWHIQNIRKNPRDYSFLKAFGAQAISRIQNTFEPNIWFSPYVHLDNVQIKYGIVSHSSLIKDLQTWNSLYISGRMHKPILELIPNKEIETPQVTNLRHCTSVSLLLLNNKFDFEMFCNTAVGLSYIGDIRNGFAESTNKIQNIVKNNIDRLRLLYLPQIQQFSFIKQSSDGYFVNCAESSDIRHMLDALPSGLKERMPKDIVEPRELSPSFKQSLKTSLYNSNY